MPEITGKGADSIMRSILAMKSGTSETKKGGAALAKGELWLKPKPLTYKRLKGDWNERLGAERTWTEQPQHPIDSTDNQVLKSLRCPSCSEAYPTQKLRIKTGYHFSNLKCKSCHETSSSNVLDCQCGIPWPKFRTHTHAAMSPDEEWQRETRQALVASAFRKRQRDQAQVDRPLPKSSRNESLLMQILLANEPRRTCALAPGSILAQRFPHLMTCSPTKG